MCLELLECTDHISFSSVRVKNYFFNIILSTKNTPSHPYSSFDFDFLDLDLYQFSVMSKCIPGHI